MNIDIRNAASNNTTTSVQYAEMGFVQNWYGTVFVTKGLQDGAANVLIKTKQDALNLIKALEKAIELNWWAE
jgi:hypothetical protein